VLLVAFGNPKQDKWIHMHSRELGVPVSIGVGGTLDFISGETKRAPMWMQRSGLEWLYRLLQEPRRLWKRYAVDLVLFSRLFWKQYWIQRKGGESVEEPIEMEGLTVPGPSLPNMTLSHSGNLTATNSQELLVRVLQFLDDNNVTQSSETNSEIILDLSDTSFIDSAGMGVLVQATRRARARGSDLRIVNLQPNVNSTIQLLRLDAFLTVGDSPNVVSSRTGYTGEISKPSPDVAVLKVPRRLDVSNVHQVIQPYGLNPDSQDCPRLIMDFSDTRFVDSASIAALLKLQKVAGENGCRLELAQVDREVRRSFDLAGAGDKFIWLNTPIPTTLEKAQ
jgi:N-acetylglucosaminyldiphosphoundecaprenol N-acetyl-beta-D-mannosaminyltransferase